MIQRRRASEAALLAAGLLAASAGQAVAAEPLRERLSLHPAATIWSAQAPGGVCAIRRHLRAAPAPLEGRHGGFRRSGALVAEILAPKPIATRVTQTARSCAERAASGPAAAALLAQEPGAAPGVAAAITACLRRAGAARYVGALTFWIDSGCDL